MFVSGRVYKWPYKFGTGVITSLSGAIILLITGGGPPCRHGTSNCVLLEAMRDTELKFHRT